MPYNDDDATVLALDIGGTKLAAGIVDRTGGVHSFLSTPSDVDSGPDASLRRLLKLGHEAVARAEVPADRIVATGISCGGPLDHERGILLCPPHLPGWIDVPITSLVQEEYGKPAVLDNDGTAAAAGEHRFARGRHTRHLVYLTLSTGVGGGVVLDGRLYRGARGNGAELGHLTVNRHGRWCRGCGRRGCLEAYVSGTSIAERAVEAGYRAPADPLTAADVARAARSGDETAFLVWQETVEALACGLVTIVNIFEPELVTIGGGVSRAGDQLLEPVKARVRGTAMKPAAGAARIVPATSGHRVGVIGAAAIAYERLVDGWQP